MKKRFLILVLVAIVVWFSFVFSKETPQIQQEVESKPIPKVVQERTPHQLVAEYAREYNVSAALITELINLENGGTQWDAILRSKCLYTKDHPEWGVKKGEQEKSYGLAQIHLPSHPSITYEQATNPDFSIRFIASEISQGRGGQWSCYRTAKYNIANGKSGGECTL